MDEGSNLGGYYTGLRLAGAPLATRASIRWRRVDRFELPHPLRWPRFSGPAAYHSRNPPREMSLQPEVQRMDPITILIIILLVLAVIYVAKRVL